MATKLEKTIKREIELDGNAYMVTISPEGIKLTQKGFRKGREVSWRELLGNDEGAGQGSHGSTGGSQGGAQNSGGAGTGSSW